MELGDLYSLGFGAWGLIPPWDLGTLHCFIRDHFGNKHLIPKDHLEEAG